MVVVTVIKADRTVEIWSSTSIILRDGKIEFHDANMIQNNAENSLHVVGRYEPPQGSYIVIT